MILSKGRGGGKPRPLVLNQATFAPLSSYLRTGPAERGRLFNVTRRAMYDKLMKVSKLSKVQFSPHDLRRTFGNRHWRAGTPIETIAHLMGHESIDMTFRAYIGVQMCDMMQAQRNLCPSAPIQLEAPR